MNRLREISPLLESISSNIVFGNDNPMGTFCSMDAFFINLLKILISYDNYALIMSQSLKTLTRSSYVTLLLVIGKSRKPLSSYSIKKEYSKTASGGTGQDVYRMLKILYPKRTYDFAMFSWNKIPGNRKEEKSLIRILNYLFGLHFNVNGNDEEIQFNKTTFKKEDNKTKLIIKNDSNTSMVFELDYPIPTVVNFVINYDGKKTERMFLFNRRDNRVYIPNDDLPEINPSVEGFLKFYSPKISYLSIKLTNHARNLINEKEKRLDDIYNGLKQTFYVDKSNAGWDFHRGMVLETSEIKKIRSEIYEIETDSANWLYYLNLRGLLLYTLGEMSLESKEKGKRKRKHSSYNNRISNVLENLSQNYQDSFPFLLYYSNYKKEFSRLYKLRKVKKSHYEVELIRSITLELQNQVSSAHIDQLKYWTNRRFNGGITFPFTSIPKVDYKYLRESPVFITADQIRDYISKSLTFQMEYLKNEYLEVETKLDEISLDKLLPFYI